VSESFWVELSASAQVVWVSGPIWTMGYPTEFAKQITQHAREKVNLNITAPFVAEIAPFTCAKVESDTPRTRTLTPPNRSLVPWNAHHDHWPSFQLHVLTLYKIRRDPAFVRNKTFPRHSGTRNVHSLRYQDSLLYPDDPAWLRWSHGCGCTFVPVGPDFS
jgi:hypothetical protein